MTKKLSGTGLREGAEARLAAMPRATESRPAAELLHELQVHQIELEMQNDTLRAAQLEAEDSRDQYQDLYDFSPVGYLTLNGGGTILRANLTIAKLLGVPRNSLIRQRFTQYVASDAQEDWYLFYRNLLNLNDKLSIELGLKRADGSGFYGQLDCLLVSANDAKPLVRISLTDSTERRRLARALAEAQVLAESEEKFRKIAEAAQDAIIMMDGNRCISFWNEAAERMFGYSAKEAIGQDTHALLAPLQGRAAFAKAYPHFRETGVGPVVGKLIELKALRKNGEEFPVELSVSATKINEQWHAIGIVRDVSERIRAVSKIQQQVVQLQDSMAATVHAMSALVEMRDPYTAGHQRRVADLAAAIARQLSLNDDQVYSIRLAGTLHDLGKISIPAEMLSNPGKLNPVEYMLIQMHPQAGYDILKDISFPWPIAQMVLQHHERMDGSGYPQGLKGEAILLEARILAVADVVEAIASHRPYRPALGIVAALEEIKLLRGTKYDANVVDACLALFQDQGYNLDSKRN